MSRVNQFYGKKGETNTLNKAGFPAHNVSLKEDYVQLVMTNTLGNTFYMDGNSLFSRTTELHEQMLTADPEFMAKTAIYGRNKSFMRLQPIIALSYLSDLTDKKYFYKAFNEIIKTPNDLRDFITITSDRRGLGRSIKKAVSEFLNDISEYHVVKYGGDRKSKRSKDGSITNNWSLKDIVRVAHPSPANSKSEAILKYITKGEINPSLTQIQAVEILKVLKEDDPLYVKKVLYTINKGRLPHEVVTGIIKPNAEIWTAIMKEMPIFALIRHLSALDKAKVFSIKENVDFVVSKLTNEEIISNSKILPFRFYTAYQNFQGDNRISEALATALDISISSMGILPGKTAWFLDVSGSMSGEYVNIGSILATAGMRQSEDSIFFTFSHELLYPRVRKNADIFSNIEEVMKTFGGCTNISQAIKHLLGTLKEKSSRYSFKEGYSSKFPESLKTTEPIHVDNIVIITDEQQNSGTPLIREFRKYRKTVNPNANLFIIDVSPYHGRVANENEPGVAFIYGWSATVLDILKYAIETNESHVSLIEDLDINWN